MKYCTKCGAQLDDNAKFCNICGTPSQSESEGTTVLNNNPIAAPQPPVNTASDGKPEKAAKGSKKTLVIVLVAIVVVVLIAVIIIAANGKSGESDVTNNNSNASDSVSTAGTYDDAVDAFVNALINNQPNEVSNYMIPYASEINAAIRDDSNYYDFYMVNMIMEYSDMKELLDTITINNSFTISRVEEYELGYDLQGKYYSEEAIDPQISKNDLNILNTVINKVLSEHSMNLEVENFIYKTYSVFDENGEEIYMCQLELIETSDGCYILGFN